MKKSDFKKLQAKWYKILADAEFNDIEQDEIYFKGRATSVIDYRYATWEATEEYYYMARMFLNTHKFKDHLERIMWEYHANGLSVEDIEDTLYKVRKKKLGRMAIWRRLKKLEVLMKKQNGVIK